MNGELTDWDYSGTYEGGVKGPEATDESFFSSAMRRIGSYLPTIPEQTQTQISGQLSDAIYQFARGKLDVAREKAVSAFLMTSEGRKVQAEGVRQTTAQYMPMILLAGAALVFLGFLVRR